MGFSKNEQDLGGLSQQGIDDSWLQSQIDKLRNDLDAQSNPAGALTGTPTPCGTGPNDFAIAYQRMKRRLKATFCVNCKPGTDRLKVVICPTNRRTDDAEFEAFILSEGYQLDTSQQNSGHVEFVYPAALEYDTQYDLVRIVGIDGEGNRSISPSVDPVFNTTPLAQFTTPVQFGAPSSPVDNCPPFINTLDVKTRDHDAFVEVEVWAPLTEDGLAQTWADSRCDTVVAVIDRNDLSPVERQKFEYTISESDTAVDPLSTPVANRGLVKIICTGLRVGAPYTWTKNIAWSNGERVESSGAVCNFNGGGFVVDPSLLTSVSLQVLDTDPYDGKHRFINLLFTQPSTPVALKHLTIRRKIQGSLDSTYVTIVKKFSLKDDEWHSVGAKVVPVQTVKLKGSKAYTLEAQITGIGGLQFIFTTNIGTAEEESGDIIVPTVAAPNIDWTAAGRLRIRGMLPTAGFNTLIKKYLVIYDGTNDSSTKFLDIPNRTSITGVANEASARFEFGLKSHTTLTDIKKKIYKNVFGDAGTFYAYYYAENAAVGLSNKSSDSNGIVIANINDTMSDDLDAQKIIDVSSLMSGPLNMVNNGDCGYSTSTVTNLTQWRTWNKTSNISNANTGIISTTSADLRWDQTNHSIVWEGNGSAIVQRLRTLVPGDFYSYTFMIKANGVFLSPFPILTLGLIKQATTTDELTTTPTIDVIHPLGGVGSDYFMVGATFQFSPTGDGSTAHWIIIKTTQALNPATPKTLILDRFMLVRGKQPFSYIPAPNDGSVISGTTDFDVSPAAIVSPDVGNATNGTQGGWFSDGFGGSFTI